jgi:hypothetical protein
MIVGKQMNDRGIARTRAGHRNPVRFTWASTAVPDIAARDYERFKSSVSTDNIRILLPVALKIALQMAADGTVTLQRWPGKIE